jgi:hypothetical protein
MLAAHPNELAPEALRGRFRRLRIAWSVGWGLLAVLLIAVWVQSDSIADSVSLARYAVVSNGGLLTVFIFDDPQLNRTYYNSSRLPPPDAGCSSLHFGSFRHGCRTFDTSAYLSGSSPSFPLCWDYLQFVRGGRAFGHALC